jgi:hypothetical protein
VTAWDGFELPPQGTTRIEQGEGVPAEQATPSIKWPAEQAGTSN